MREAHDFSFVVSLSTEKFDHKPNRTTEVGKMRFNKTTMDVNGFAEAILNGYAYTTVFASDSFGMGEKTNPNFVSSNFISLDFDHKEINMDAMIDKMEYKPTIGYTTCSNGVDGYSYRLIYCFDGGLDSVGEYRDYVLAVLKANDLCIRDIDKNSTKAVQVYFGNGTDNSEAWVNNIIYSKNDFSLYVNDINITYNNVLYSNNKSVNENYVQTHHNNICLNDTFEDKQFENDYRNMKIGDILAKYVGVYPNMEHTPLPTADEDTPYIEFPTDYIEIRRDWWIGNGGMPIKIKDGQGRRHKLFINGILRRMINPSITFDNLLYNLLYELYHYISNCQAKNVIGKKELLNIAKDVMRADLSIYECLKGTKRKYIVNREFCIKYGLSPNQVKNSAKKSINDNKIGEIYDSSLTDKENLELLERSGVKVSLSTLKRWRKEHGMTKNKKRK